MKHFETLPNGAADLMASQDIACWKFTGQAIKDLSSAFTESTFPYLGNADTVYAVKPGMDFELPTTWLLTIGRAVGRNWYMSYVD